jgi:gamma-glutamylputrescine oxidase
VLAANAFTSKLGYLRQVVTPVFDYLGITPVLSEQQLAALGWKSRLPFNDTHTETYYLGMTPDNRIHIGGGPVDYSFNNGVRDRPDAPARYAGIYRELLRLYPALAGVPFATTWGGSVDVSLDQAPTVGQMGKYKNVFYALGFSGHGVNLTSVFGRIIADLIAGRGDEWRWLPFLNHLPLYTPNEPFRWLGVHLSLEYYRSTEK